MSAPPLTPELDRRGGHQRPAGRFAGWLRAGSLLLSGVGLGLALGLELGWRSTLADERLESPAPLARRTVEAVDSGPGRGAEEARLQAVGSARPAVDEPRRAVQPVKRTLGPAELGRRASERGPSERRPSERGPSERGPSERSGLGSADAGAEALTSGQEVEGARAQGTPGARARREASVRRDLALVEHDLRELADALSAPEEYRHVRAVRADLVAYRAARERREALWAALRELGAERGATSIGSGSTGEELVVAAGLVDVGGADDGDALLVPIRGTPPGFEYLAPQGSSLRRPDGLGDAELGGPPRLLLGNRDLRRRLAFRFRRAGGPECAVEVREAPDGRGDQLRVAYVRDGREVLVRESRLEGHGAVWSGLLGRFLTRGAVEHDALQGIVTAPLDGCPPSGWFTWLRRHLELPPNEDLGEGFGALRPLPGRNPLLLRGPAGSPVLLDRPDLRLAPDRVEPPVPPPARGPLVVIARNGLGIHDGSWRWLVFDEARREVIEHVRVGDRVLRWVYLPAAGLDPTRETQAFKALAERAERRTRQALDLLTLRREIDVLQRELAGKVGGVYTRDGLAACRLREEILHRFSRLQALSHLLLDEQGIRRVDRAVAHAERETTATVVRVIEAMVDAGRSGPVEYLLRDEAVKSLLFSAPQAYRLQLVRKFNRRFRPFTTRLRLSLTGHSPRWYESVQWFEED